jgi:hypothetical protein
MHVQVEIKREAWADQGEVLMAEAWPRKKLA